LTSPNVEEEVTDLHEHTEETAVGTTVALSTGLLNLVGTMPDGTEPENICTADWPAIAMTKTDAPDGTPPQVESSPQDHETKIPCRDVDEVAFPFQATLMSGHVLPARRPSVSEYHCEEAELAEISRPVDLSDTGVVEGAAANETENEMEDQENLDGVPLEINGEDELPRTDVSESSMTMAGRKMSRVAPEKRGGRPRGSPATDQMVRSEAIKHGVQARNQRPELVCWLKGMTYVVGVEIPEETHLPLLTVRQPPDLALEEDDSRSGLWRLKRPLESVHLLAPEPHETCAVELPSARYRIFKMVGAYKTRGRAVRQGSTGQFLIVVPESWGWNEELSGPAATTPEYVYPGTCRAHSVRLPLDPGRALAFDTPEGTCVRIPCGSERFELVGARIDDASVDAGPLFAREPPQLRCAAGIAEDTTAIAAVVLGEEGIVEGRRGWRARADRFEELRPAIADRKAGWFFVRLYDCHGELIESLDFRFVADLVSIEIKADSPMPGVEGHSVARIRFRHGRGCSVSSRSKPPVITELLPDGASAIVPCDSKSGETSWLISTRNEQVQVKIRVDRVWWALEDGATEANQILWTDRPLRLCRDEFRATSVIAIRIRLPRPGWADELRIGFQWGRSRSVHIGASELECVIPLRDMGEARELEEQAAALLSIWVVPRGITAERLEGVVGFLLEVGISIDDQGFLCSLHQMKARLLIAALTRIRTAGSVPLRQMIREFRTERYQRIPKHRRGKACEPFVEEGLCLLALAIEQLEVQKTRGTSLSGRWRIRARAASVYFPSVMAAVRSRHREIESKLANRGAAGASLRTDRC
jgi:hypothetical protein